MKEKGFTLIELLAVIVILAIVALIATPIILGIIKDAKEQSTLRSAELYIDAVEQAIVRKNLEGEYNPDKCEIQDGEVACEGKFSPTHCEIQDGELNCQGVPLEVEIDGEVPKDGTIVFQKGKATSGSKLIFTGYETNINKDGKMEINPKTKTESTPKKYNNGDIVYFDIKEGKKCTNYHEDNSKTGYNGIYEGESSTKTTNNQNNCLKFYAFNDDESDRINLLLDHNTTAEIAWAKSDIYTNANGPIDVINQLKIDTSEWNSPIISKNYEYKGKARPYTIKYNTEEYKARLITAQEIAQITGADKEDTLNWKEESSTNEYYFDSLLSSESDTCKSGNITGCKYGWLYDRTHVSCTANGCLHNSDANITGYWTSSAYAKDSYYAWRVDNFGHTDDGFVNASNGLGIRPVIEVLRTNL